MGSSLPLVPAGRARPCVLFTDVGHPVAPSALRSLNGRYRIIGVDAEDVAGQAWVDESRVVPPPEAPDYVSRLLDICRGERVDVVVPWTDAEAEVIAPAEEEFRAAGATLLCPPARAVARVADKGRMLADLQASGLACPRFQLASDSKGVADAAQALGYPSNPVVVKPRRSSGSRGLWILSPAVDLGQRHPSRTITLECLLVLLRQAEEAAAPIPPYVVMEFLPGDDYSVDVLARKGEILMMVPRRRIRAVGGVSQVGEIRADGPVMELAATVARAFDLRTCFNVQARYSSGASCLPLVYEINPRVSGTVVASAATGVNMLDAAIRLALGEEWTRPAWSLAPVRLRRFWDEHYRGGGPP